MSQSIEDGDDLPTVTHSSEMVLCGFTLTAHVLSNGQRVFEDNGQFRDLLEWLGTDNPRVVETLAARKETP